jgi:mannan endo-1,4-beta-mannosidase
MFHRSPLLRAPNRTGDRAAKSLWIVASLLLWLLPGSAAAVPVSPLPDGAFVRVRGTEFVVGDRPFRFVGANIDPMHGDMNRPRYREILDALVIDGLTVGRIWALGEDTAAAGPWLRQYALFRAGPDGFIEEGYRQLDRVLAAARRLGLRLIITLSNHWADYGGAPMYLRWAGKNPDGLGLEEFYSDEKTRAWFREGLLRLLTRTNTVNGVAYADDPTIFSWELMNESSVISPRGQEGRLRWIREMAQLIRQHDKNHMISAGLLGYSYRRERDEWIRVHKLPEVDYCDSHIYMQNSEGGVSVERMYDFLDDRAQLALHVIKKPLVIGEFSFRTDGPKNYLGIPRAEWFERFLRRHFRNQGAGALVWIYQPYSGKPRDFGVYIDRPDTEDVRMVLRRTAMHVASTTGQAPLAGVFGPPNPRLSAANGAKPLYETRVLLHGNPAPHKNWRRPRPEEHLLEIPPSGFSRADFERAGYWDGPQVAHAYGGDAGEFVYRFTPPELYYRPAVVEIEARMSSEWPGAVAPPDGGSEVELLIDGIPAARFAVPPDDGVGDRRTIRIHDPRLLSRLFRGVHTLTFRISDTKAAHGLCIYGDFHGSEPPPAGEFSPILIRYFAGVEKN